MAKRTIKTEQNQSYDYTIVDLNNYDFPVDGVIAPLPKIDLSEILSRVDEKLTESFGNYGTLNILFTRSSKTELQESALLEYRSKEKIFTLQFKILESKKQGFYNVQVRNTLGKKLYERDTKNPELIVNSFFKFVHYKINI